MVQIRCLYQYLWKMRRLGLPVHSNVPQNLGSPFLVMNGDVLTQIDFRHILKFHSEHKGIATLCARQYEVSIPFGVINHEGPVLTSLVEKPTKKYLVNAGLYVLDPKILPLLDSGLSQDMPSLLDKAMALGHTVNVCPIHEYWLDVGRPETLIQAHEDWSVTAA